MADKFCSKDNEGNKPKDRSSSSFFQTTHTEGGRGLAPDRERSVKFKHRLKFAIGSKPPPTLEFAVSETVDNSALLILTRRFLNRRCCAGGRGPRPTASYPHPADGRTGSRGSAVTERHGRTNELLEPMKRPRPIPSGAC